MPAQGDLSALRRTDSRRDLSRAELALLARSIWRQRQRRRFLFSGYAL